MEIVLLDSKRIPLMMNESTSGESFWTSSRKVLATNKAVYLKVSGRSTELGRASIDPQRRIPVSSDAPIIGSVSGR